MDAIASCQKISSGQANVTIAILIPVLDILKEIMRYEKIKADSLQSRKDRSELAPFLVTLLGDLQRAAKDAGKEIPTDSQVISVLNKYKKNALEILNAPLVSDDHKETATKELNYLNANLPMMMTYQETVVGVDIVVGTGMFGPKDMGPAMKYLKGKYQDCLDVQLASTIMKQKLSQMKDLP